MSRSTEFEQGKRNGIKRCVEFVMGQARKMNHAPARCALYMVADHMGKTLKNGGNFIDLPPDAPQPQGAQMTNPTDELVKALEPFESIAADTPANWPDNTALVMFARDVRRAAQALAAYRSSIEPKGGDTPSAPDYRTLTIADTIPEPSVPGHDAHPNILGHTISTGFPMAAYKSDGHDAPKPSTNPSDVEDEAWLRRLRLPDRLAKKWGEEDKNAIIDRLLARLCAPMVDEGQFAWLIEAPGQRYLGAQTIDHQASFHWTADAQKALRFWSKEQADQTMMAVRRLHPDLWGFALTLGEAWPREHKWLAAQKPGDASEQG